MERVESPARDLCGNVMAITSPMEITLQDSADAKDQLSPLPCLYLPY